MLSSGIQPTYICNFILCNINYVQFYVINAIWSTIIIEQFGQVYYLMSSVALSIIHSKSFENTARGPASFEWGGKSDVLKIEILLDKIKRELWKLWADFTI